MVGGGASRVTYIKLLQAQDGETALIWAAQNGHVECVRLLVASGANNDLWDNVRAHAALSYDDILRFIFMRC